MTRDDVASSGLLVVVSALSVKGVALLDTDLWSGVVVLGLAVGLGLVRAYLQQKGWAVGGRR